MYARAAIISAYSSLEAEVNGCLEQVEERIPNNLLHEIAFIRERRVEFNGAGFVIQGQRYRSLREKIQFLYSKYATAKKPDTGFWERLKYSADKRDGIVHAKGEAGDKTIVTAENAGQVVADVDKILEQLHYAHEDWLRRNRRPLRN